MSALLYCRNIALGIGRRGPVSRGVAWPTDVGLDRVTTGVVAVIYTARLRLNFRHPTPSGDAFFHHGDHRPELIVRHPVESVKPPDVFHPARSPFRTRGRVSRLPPRCATHEVLSDLSLRQPTWQGRETCGPAHAMRLDGSPRSSALASSSRPAAQVCGDQVEFCSPAACQRLDAPRLCHPAAYAPRPHVRRPNQSVHPRANSLRTLRFLNS